MATPNIVGVSTITGFTTYTTATTAATSLVSNANSSNSILKINLISGSNIAQSTQYLSVGINNLAAGAGTTTWILRNVGITSASSLVVTDKASSFYLTENSSLVIQASANTGVDVTVSYDSIR